MLTESLKRRRYESNAEHELRELASAQCRRQNVIFFISLSLFFALRVFLDIISLLGRTLWCDFFFSYAHRKLIFCARTLSIEHMDIGERVNSAL